MILEKQEKEGCYHIISSFTNPGKDSFWCVETKCQDKSIIYRASLLVPGIEVCALKFKTDVNTIKLYINFLGEGSTEVSYPDQFDSCIAVSFKRIELALENALMRMSIYSYKLFKLAGRKVN